MKVIYIAAAAVTLLIAMVFTAYAQYTGLQDGAVGVVIEKKRGEVVVRDVRLGMGAARAGISKGDVIVAINGVPVVGKFVDEVERMLGGGVGTDVSLTVRGPDGVDRVAPVIRESLPHFSDVVLPIRMNLPKPHDLRPEDGMVCTIASVTGRTAVINCGQNAGVDRWQQVRFIRRADYARHRTLATGKVTKVHDYTSTVSVSGNASAVQGPDVIVVTSAWRSERARESTLWRVAAHGITILDYPTGLPYATIDQLRIDTGLKIEQAAVTTMVERLKEAAVMADQVYAVRIHKGRFRGKSLSSAFRNTSPKDMMSFLTFLITYPDQYIGREWFLPEIYATWILNGTPNID